MTITTGLNISLTDFNTLQTSVGNILYTGTGNKGYGQTPSSYQSNGGSVSAAEWARLKVDILKIANHQGIASNASILSLIGATFTGVISNTTLTVSNLSGTIAIGDAVIGLDILPGTVITGGSGVSWTVNNSQTVSSRSMQSGGSFSAGDKIAASSIKSFTNAVTAVNTNTFLIAQYSDESFSPTISHSRSTSWGSSALPTVNHIFTVDFGSSNNARYFFNSGSSLRFSASRAGGTSSLQNTNWTNMLSAMGTIIFNYNATTASAGTGSSIGFYNLTATDRLIFSTSGSGNYSTNTYKINARSDVTNNTTGTARYLYISISFTDTHSNSFYDTVDGVLASNVTMRRASGSNVSVTAPTATNTSVVGDNGVVVTPTYSIVPSASSVNEGSAITFTITTTNVGSATLYWTNSGTTSAADFSDNLNSGSITITSNSGSLSKTLASDLTTEGSETIIINLRTGSTSGPIVATASTVAVSDTSQAAPITYTLVSSPVISAASGITLPGRLTITSNSVWNPGSSAGISNMWQYSSTSNGTYSNILADSTYTITKNDNGFYFRLRQSSPDSLNFAQSNVLGPIAIPTTPLYTGPVYFNSVNEGGSGSIVLYTANVALGSTYYWTVANTSTSSADFAASSGSITISSSTTYPGYDGEGSFVLSTIADSLTEGTETFYVQFRVGSTSGAIVAQCGSITLNDTSTAPVPTFTLGAVDANEGYTTIHSIYSVNVPIGATYYWNIDHITTSAADFYSNGGSFVIATNTNSSLPNYTGESSISYSRVNDLLLEGTEYYRILITDVSGTVLFTSGTCSVGDTSVPEVISYDSVVSVGGITGTTVNEGSSMLVTVYTINVITGTTLYWTISNSTTSNADFSATSGSFVITTTTRPGWGCDGSFTITPTNDALTEGSESFSIDIHTGSTSGTVVHTISSLTINDTSLTPGYGLSFSSTLNENSTNIVNFYTTNVANGTTFYWTITNVTTANVDFSATSGSFSTTTNTDSGWLGFSGKGTFNIITTNDYLIEGTETFTLDIRTGSLSGPSTISSTISILDTSVPIIYGSFTNLSGTVISSTYNDANVNVNWTAVGTSPGTPVSITVKDGDNSTAYYNSALSGASGNTGSIALTHNGTAQAIFNLPTLGNYISTTTIPVTTRPAPTYTYGTFPAGNSISEGGSGTFTINTTNVPDGTTLYWTLDTINGTSSADFSAISGSFTINSNVGSFTVSAVADYLTEGSEGFGYLIRTGSTSGTIVLSVTGFGVADTSLSPTITYPTSVSAHGDPAVVGNIGQTFSWSISGGIPNEAFTVYFDGANTGGPYNLSLNSSGNYSQSGSFFINAGTTVLHWSFPSTSRATPYSTTTTVVVG